MIKVTSIKEHLVQSETKQIQDTRIHAVCSWMILWCDVNMKHTYINLSFEFINTLRGSAIKPKKK